MFVSSKEEDKTPLVGIQRAFEWQYQRKILEAARVDVTKDDEARIGEKVRKMWMVAEELGITVCRNTKFSVTNGNIIKFAVNLQFDEFVIDMTQWGVNLNMVDESDGRTVLDYTQYQLETNRGLATEPVLRRYYDMLRKAGAKHAKDLR